MLETLLKRIMAALSNESPHTLSNHYIFALINEAQLNLATYSDKTTTEVIEVEAEESVIDMPEDLFRLVTVYWGDDISKKELSPQTGRLPLDSVYEDEDGEGLDTGDPTSYYVNGDSLIIRPIPQTEGNLYILYIAKPAIIVEADDDLTFPDAAGYIFNYVINQYYLNDGNIYVSNNWKPKMEESLWEWINNSSNQNYTHPIVVKPRW